jgi:hypothetical protein
MRVDDSRDYGGGNSWTGYVEVWNSSKPRNCRFPESLLADGYVPMKGL